ncbi:MAG: hypothetical protein R2778_06395 [Saprospiraceae bacterium]
MRQTKNYTSCRQNSTAAHLYKKASLAGAAFAVPGTVKSVSKEKASGVPAVFSSKPKLKIRLGFIGTGLRGQNHLGAALLREDCEITAIADPDPRMLGDALKMIEKNGAKKPKVYGDHTHQYEELVADKNVDAVVISTLGMAYTAGSSCHESRQICSYGGMWWLFLDECWQLVNVQGRNRNATDVSGKRVLSSGCNGGDANGSGGFVWRTDTPGRWISTRPSRREIQ